MTTISRDTVLSLARLSSLGLLDEEVDGLTKNIEDVLGYIESLNELDTEGVEPTYQVTGLENIWRQDEIKSSLGKKKLLDLAPSVKDDQIEVPKVL